MPKIVVSQRERIEIAVRIVDFEKNSSFIFVLTAADKQDVLERIVVAKSIEDVLENCSVHFVHYERYKQGEVGVA